MYSIVLTACCATGAACSRCKPGHEEVCFRSHSAQPWFSTRSRVVEGILISTCCQHAEHELYFLLQLGQFSELVVAFSFQDIRKSQECRFLAAWIFLYLMLESQELACYWSSVCRFFIIIRQSRQFCNMYIQSCHCLSDYSCSTSIFVFFRVPRCLACLKVPVTLWLCSLERQLLTMQMNTLTWLNT